MAKAPFLFDPKGAATKVRAALAAARTRTGNEGHLVALSAGGLLLAFVLLAALAPLAMGAPDIVSTLTGFVIFGLVVVATGLGILALWRMIKAGAMEGASPAQGTTSVFSQSAIDAALSDAHEAGLRAFSTPTLQDAITGRLCGRPIAICTADGATFAVLRLREAAPATLLLTPNQQPWPYAFPADGPLTPVQAPQGVDALAWSTKFEVGQALIAKLAPALTMSQTGGAVPFVSVRGRALVLMWPQGEVTTAGLILGEVAKAFGDLD
jgi:hypothetical protein